MRQLSFYYIIILLFVNISIVHADDNDIIREHIINYYSEKGISYNTINTYLDSQKSDGSWSDIDYADDSRAGWDPVNHIGRVLKFATAYVNPDVDFYQSSVVLQAILDGVNYWVDNDFTSPNDWYNSISVPQQLAEILILIDEDLSDSLLQKSLTILNRSTIQYTGMNRVWLANNVMMRSLLTNNSSELEEAISEILNELAITSDEGIQPDYSFHQHGAQMQMGNYGITYASNFEYFVRLFIDTQYAPDEEKLAVLRNYILEGTAVLLWDGNFDLNGCGRRVNEDTQTYMGKLVKQLLTKMTVTDSDYEAEYQKCLEYPNVKCGTKLFWRSDFAVHRSIDWYCSVKMSSTRTVCAESTNDENTQGLHLSDGIMLLYQTGDEYQNIQPTWDWHRLPGTTCDQSISNLDPDDEMWNTYGNSDFAGGIGCDTTGVVAMEYKRNELSSKKAYFFEKDAVICLGAEIDGNTSGKVLTSVEQSLLKGEVTTSSGSKSMGEYAIGKGGWVHHNNTGYYLLNDATIKLETVEGNWNLIFPTQGDDPVANDIFNIWIDHGISPQNQSYAYIVYPEVQSEDMDDVINNSSIQILQNNSDVQAVYSNSGIHSVFYNESNLIFGNDTISVDNPCVLSIRKSKMIISDPTQSLASLIVEINGEEYIVDLPQGDRAGSKVSIDLPGEEIIKSGMYTTCVNCDENDFWLSGNILYLSDNSNVSSVQFFDVAGDLKVTLSKDISNRIDVGLLNKGIYVVKVVGMQGGVRTKKVLIQ